MKQKIFKIFGIILLILILGIVGILFYVTKGLPNVGPAPDLTIQADSALIQRGAYLALHVTVCMDCHSQRDWTHFSGPLVPGTLGQGGERFDHKMGFPGIFYAKNLTPFNLKDWTDGEIYRAITTGVSKNGEAIFPVMPYHNYGFMDPDDVKAIIAFLRTLEPIENKVQDREIDFPMNFIVNTIPHKAQPMDRPAQSDSIAYGEYLVKIAGCRECHTKKVKGKVVGKPFAGGWAFHMPDGSIIQSANITPDKETGIGYWTEATFIGFFKSKARSGAIQAPVLQEGQMQTVMPWTMYAGMDTGDLAAIYSYLKSLEPVKNQVVVFTPAKTLN